MSSHNNRIHPRTKKAPIDVDESDSGVLFRRLYPNIMSKRNKLKKKSSLKIGDLVKVAKKFLVLRHGYLESWNPDVYTVARVLDRISPPRYVLKTKDDGEEVAAAFYAQELQRVIE